MNHLTNATPVTSPARRFLGMEIRWGMWLRWNRSHNTCWWLAAIVLVALPAAAQLTIGDNLNMSASGNLGFTYGASIDQGESSHGTGFTGNGNIAGSYYNPNFLNFNVAPFYNRTQSSSIFGNLTNSSGVGASLNVFNGSHFPGSFSYNKVYNDTGQYGIPGSDIGLAATGNEQSFGFGWNALLPGWPTFTVNYLINSTDESIFGGVGTSSETDKTLNLGSNYKFRGWQLMGHFTHRNTDSSFPDFSQPQEVPVQSDSSNNGFGAAAQHALPLTGNFGVSLTHIGYSYSYADSSSGSGSGGSTSINSNASFHPLNNFGFSFTESYNDSLLGSIPQPVLNTGTPLNLVSLGSFRSNLFGTDVYYMPLTNLAVHFDVNHVYETFLGETYSATQFGGSANYNFDRSLLKGLSFSFGLVDTAQQATDTGLGFVGTLNYNRRLSGWDVSGNFSYAQNVATSLLVYTTSSYNYLSSVRRRLNDRTQFLFGYSGAHSGLSANSGTSSSAQRAFSTIFYRGYNLNGFYTKSNGEAIFTATGLVPVPTTLPTEVLSGANLSQYESEGWGVGLGGSPIRRVVFSVSYGKSNGSTIDPVLSLYTNNTLITSSMTYRLRKVFLNAGYTRLTQDVGVEGTMPVHVMSYYVGISRWFNFF